jgi:SAM-dependent methyltransferase
VQRPQTPDKDPLVPLTSAMEHRPALPSPLPPFNEWTYADRHGPGLKNRFRAVLWRIVTPLLGLQRPFNSTIVDQVNRILAAQRASELHVAQYEARVHQHLMGTESLAQDWLRHWDALEAREMRTQQRVDEYVASVDDLRASAALAHQAALSLKRDVEELLARGTAPRTTPGTTPGPAPAEPGPDLDAFKYVGFEDAFRGSREDIRARLAEYAPRFDGLSNVIDLGCGRGEFLELLRARGITARGVDVNHAMVEACRANGLDATEGDALQFFESLDDASVGGIFSAQVVEHLKPGYLARLLETAAHKVRPGGLVILETINPASWVAFFESFIRDITHVWPLHPQTLQYLMRASGFREVAIEYRSPVPESGRLRPLPAPPFGVDPATEAFVATFNENVEKLNMRLFGYLDYAVVARR